MTTRHDPDPAPRDKADDHTADHGVDGRDDAGDEVRRLDRELAVANDLAPDDSRRDEPGIAPGRTP